jgi:ferric-dicitrate binding protein FerR (iron transport regulator)
MNRSLLPLLGAAAALAALCSVAALAAQGDRILSNVRGSVTYVSYPTGEARDLALNASTLVKDDDVAKTGDRSMAKVTLPDSSVVTLGSNTAIKLDTFDAASIAKAHFVVAYGKLRFHVEHPAGAKADFTFSTPTGEIAVRGTEGDISVDPFDGVRVNVYRLSDAALPVHVNMINGLTFDIPAGQKIWMRWQSGTLVGKVLPLTQAEIDRFAEFGAPAQSP